MEAAIATFVMAVFMVILIAIPFLIVVSVWLLYDNQNIVRFYPKKKGEKYD